MACLLTERCQAGLCVPQSSAAPEIALFDITPRRVEPGQPAQLTYVVLFADRVQIEPALPNRPGNELDTSSGTVELLPQETTTYTLRASRGDREITASIELTVGASIIERFEAAHGQSQVQLDETVLLRWRTKEAAQVELLEDGAPIYTAPQNERAQGQLLIQPQRSARYALVADGDQRALDITVLIPPRILEFSLSREVVELGAAQSAEPIEARWRVIGDPPLSVRLEAGESVFPGLEPEGRFVALEPPLLQNERVKLVVEQQDRVVETSEMLIVLAPEEEPNSAEQPNTATIGRLGQPDTPQDEDWYLLELPQGGLAATALFGLGASCPSAGLSLWTRDARTLLAEGFGSCPQWALAPSLPPGAYLVQVRAPSDAYALFAEGVAPGCGDGVVQTNFGETCDDSNRSDLDGCDRSCRLEPDRAYFARPAQSAPEAALEEIAPGEGTVLALPFRFPFFGARYPAVVVHPEGYLSFWPDQRPSGAAPRAAIMLFAGAVVADRVRAGSTPQGGFRIDFAGFGSVTLSESGAMLLSYERLSPVAGAVGLTDPAGRPALSLCETLTCSPQALAQLSNSAWALLPERLR